MMEIAYKWNYTKPNNSLPLPDGNYNLVPNWDSLVSFCGKLRDLVYAIPWEQRLVLYFCYRGATVKVEFGDVKTAGVLAILGLGVGVGTVLLYRIYTKFACPSHGFDGTEDEDGKEKCRVFVETCEEEVKDSPVPKEEKASNCKSEYGVAYGKDYKKKTRLRKTRLKDHHRSSLDAIQEINSPKRCVKSKNNADNVDAVDPPHELRLPRTNDRDTSLDLLDPHINPELLQSSVLLTPADDSVRHDDSRHSANRSGYYSREQTPGSYAMSESMFSYTGTFSESSSFYDLGFETSGLETSFEADRSSGYVGSESEVLAKLDYNFRQNLLQRVSEWNAGSQEESSDKSGSISPDIRSTPDRHVTMRRVRPHITVSESGSRSGPYTESRLKELDVGNDIGLRTSKNLEDIQDELSDLFGEFDYLNTKLSELSSRKSDVTPPMVFNISDDLANGSITSDASFKQEITPAESSCDIHDFSEQGSETSGLARDLDSIRARHILCCSRTPDQADRSQSLPPLDSTGSVSRSNSILEGEMTWDIADISRVSRDSSFSHALPSVWMANDRDSLAVMQTLSNLGEALDDKEWDHIAKSTNHSKACMSPATDSNQGKACMSSAMDSSNQNEGSKNGSELNLNSDKLCLRRNTSSCDIGLDDVYDSTNQNEEFTGSANQNRDDKISPDRETISSYGMDTSCSMDISMDSKSMGWSEHSDLKSLADESDCDNIEPEPPSLGDRLKPSTTESTQNVSEPLDIHQYAACEWKGTSDKAEAIRLGYKEVVHRTHCMCLRRIRGDNYCAIRAALYQLMRSGLHIPRFTSSHDLLNKFDSIFRANVANIQSWSFGGRFSTADIKETYHLMRQCLMILFAKLSECQNHTSTHKLTCSLDELYNSDRTLDLQLMEAVKILMVLNAIELYDDQAHGNDVPVFVWLLYARDSCETPEELVRNHINPVGDSGGLEQVEMCLLGYSLGVTLRVFRLSQFGHEDFITYFPDETKSTWPSIILCSEDDRHYNVVVP